MQYRPEMDERVVIRLREYALGRHEPDRSVLRFITLSLQGQPPYGYRRRPAPGDGFAVQFESIIGEKRREGMLHGMHGPPLSGTDDIEPIPAPSSSRSQAVSMTCPSIITQPSCSSLAVWSEALNLSRAMSCSQSPMSSLFLAVMGIEMLFVYPVLPYSGEVTEATDTDTDTGQAASISAKRPSMNSSIMLKVLGKPGSPVPDCKRYRSGYTITERMRQRKDIRRDEALLLHTPHPRRSRNEGESFHPQTRQIS